MTVLQGCLGGGPSCSNSVQQLSVAGALGGHR
jgi:hypothetical protein